MSFEQIRVLGASVRSISANLGLNNSISQLTAALVEDLRNGDNFSPPSVGTPVFFTLGGFTFNGLLQSYQTQRSLSGAPLYEVILLDPRALLEGTQLILGGYAGTIPVRNILNIFGYYESTGFGNSYQNEAGMPWSMIVNAVHTLTALSSGNYGSALNLKGYNYRVDLSLLPAAPSLYRMGGGQNTITLMEAIDRFCYDAGCDYFITLTSDYIIRVNPISRFTQPPLGTLSTYINNTTGVSSSNSGVEFRNESTGAFVIGGPVQYLQETSSIYPVWGFDAGTGLPILGSGSGNAHAMNLNATSVADIIGSISYPCTVLELRMAMYNEEMWYDYIARIKPALATLLQIKPEFNLNVANVANAQSIEQIIATVPGIGAQQTHEQILNNQQRLYNFVRKHADEFYGQRFLVQLSDIQYALEPETNRVKTSQEISDGGFLPEGAGPLGLEAGQADLFKTEDGRFQCFVRYTANLLSYALDKVNPAYSYLQYSGGVPVALFIKASADQQIYWISGVPFALVTLSGSPVSQLGVGIYNDMTTLAQYFAVALNQVGQEAAFVEMLQRINTHSGGGTLAMGVANALIYPDAAAIPIKSNLSTYGPWYGATTSGKVTVEQDANLVPWQYNGYSLLNTAGSAKVFGAVTNMQASESGQIEVAGAPEYSLGDLIIANGPNLTNITITWDVSNGVRTSYRFESFTPRFGRDAQLQGRLLRISKSQSDATRNLKRAQRDRAELRNAVVDAAQAPYQGLLRRNRRQSPHDMVMGYIKNDIADATEQIAGVSFATQQEVKGSLCKGDSDEFQKQAGMSLNGLLRPFSTDPADTNLPHYETPDLGVGSTAITVDDLNPFQYGHDIGLLIGDTTLPTEGMDARWQTEMPGAAGTPHVRPLALRGPIVICGWGYDIQGNLVPDAV